MTSPHIMKCLHSFCKQCLETTANETSLNDVKGYQCPECKEFTALSDVTACTRTEQLLALYERVTKPKVCFQCETESAEWKCNGCVEFYCDACKQLHDKIKMFRSHECVAASDAQEEMVIQKVIHCTKHPDVPVELFCVQCSTLVCLHCATLDHEGHERDSIDKSLPQVVELVGQELGKVKQLSIKYKSVNSPTAIRC